MDSKLSQKYHALKNSDHLFDTKCLCLICVNSQQTPNPQISIDHKYQLLKSSKPKTLSRLTPTLTSSKDQNNIQGLEWYLRKLAFECKTLPDFPILDTFVMEKGQLSLYIYFQNGKPKLHLNSLITQSKSYCKYSQSLPYSLNTLKQKFMQRKVLNDIDYQKTKYKEINPSFEYAQLDHDSQKLIKEFEKKVKYLDPVLNRVATIKQREKTSESSPSRNQPYRLKGSTTPIIQQETTEKVLSRYELMNLFDKTRVKVCQVQELSYMQLFPIMYGQEEQSYVRQVKYFREMESMKPLFKQAQTYVLSWLQKNDTLQKMEQQFINNHFYNETNLRKVGDFPTTAVKRLSPHVEEQFLMYQSCKLLLHLEAETSIEISQCLLQFITVNNGATFYLKSLNYIKYSQKPTVLAKENKLPVYKNIDKDDYIHDIQKEMRQMFENVSYQYERLNKDWENFENKTKNDRMHSDQVFKTVRGFEELDHVEEKDLKDSFVSLEDFQPVKFQSTLKKQKQDNLNLHQILKSTNQKYKEQMLGLNAKFKTSPQQPKITSRTKVQAKNSKK